MRNYKRSKLFLWTSMVTIVIFMLASCSTIEIQKVTPEKADYYKFVSQNAGFKISVDPYKEENRLKEYFGCDLLSRGILPVLLVIENQDAEDGYILVKENSGLLIENPDSKNTLNNSGNESYKADNLNQAVKTDAAIKNLGAAALVGSLPFYATGAIAGPIILVGIIPMAMLEKRVKDELEIKKNVEDNLIVNKTIYRGGSHNGFLYFKLNSKDDMVNVKGILICIKNIRTNELLSFKININEL